MFNSPRRASMGHYTVVFFVSSLLTSHSGHERKRARGWVNGCANDTYSLLHRWFGLDHPSALTGWIHRLTWDFTRGLREVKKESEPRVRAITREVHAFPLGRLMCDSQRCGAGGAVGPERWPCCPGRVIPALSVVVHKDLAIYMRHSCMCLFIVIFNVFGC